MRLSGSNRRSDADDSSKIVILMERQRLKDLRGIVTAIYPLGAQQSLRGFAG